MEKLKPYIEKVDRIVKQMDFDTLLDDNSKYSTCKFR